MTDEVVRLEVADDDDGERLDRFLAGRITGRTRSALRRWIVEGRVTIEGRPVEKPGRSLETGSVVMVSVPPEQPDAPEGQSIPLDVLFEDFGTIFGLTLGLMVLKGLVLLGLARLFRLEPADGWLFAVGLAQAGEFGFVMLSFSIQNSVIPAELAKVL